MMITPVAAPCKGCPDHKLGCHSGCERYAEYRAYREEIIKRRKEAQKDRENGFTSGGAKVVADRAQYEKQRGRKYSR